MAEEQEETNLTEEVEMNPLQPDICIRPKKQEPDKICPDCVPDQSYTPPTEWWDLEDPELNKLTCEYWVPVSINSFADSYSLGNYTSSGYSLQTLMKTYVRAGVRKIIRFLDKLEADEIICATPPTQLKGTCRGIHDMDYEQHLRKDPVWANGQVGYSYTFDTPEVIAAKNPLITNSKAIELYGRAQDYYFAGMGESSTLVVLVTLPAYIADNLPDAPKGAEVNTAEEETIVNAKKFLRQLAQLAASFNLFSKYQAYFYQYENGRLTQKSWEKDQPDRTLYLKYFDERIDKFEKHLSTLIDRNGYNWGSWAIFGAIESIKFVWDKSDERRPFAIKSVWVKAGDCDWVEMKKGLNSFKSKPVMGQTLLGYISKINSMEAELNGRVSPPWLDFVIKYTYPPIKVNYGMSNLTSEFELGCVGENLQQIDDFILNEVVSFSEAFQYNLNKENCKTLARKGISDPLNPASDKDYKEFEDMSRSAKKFIKHIKSEKRVPFSPFSDWIKKIKQRHKEGVSPAGQIGREFSTVFSMVNPCKWKEITIEAAKCIMAGLDIKTVYLAFIKKTLANLAGDGLRIVFDGLPPEKQDHIMKVIREEFKDMPMPWEAGYVVGGAYSESMDQKIGDRVAKRMAERDRTNLENAKAGASKQTIEARFTELGFEIEENIIQPFLLSYNVKEGPISQPNPDIYEELEFETERYINNPDLEATNIQVGDEIITAPSSQERYNTFIEEDLMEEIKYQQNLYEAGSKINFADSKYDQYFTESDNYWVKAYESYRATVDPLMASAYDLYQQIYPLRQDIKKLEKELSIASKTLNEYKPNDQSGWGYVTDEQIEAENEKERSDFQKAGNFRGNLVDIKYSDYMGQVFTDAKNVRWQIRVVNSKKNMIVKAYRWRPSGKKVEGKEQKYKKREKRNRSREMRALEQLIFESVYPDDYKEPPSVLETMGKELIEMQEREKALSKKISALTKDIGTITSLTYSHEPMARHWSENDQVKSIGGFTNKIPEGITTPYYEDGFEDVYFKYEDWREQVLIKEIEQLRVEYTNAYRKLYETDKTRYDNPEYVAWETMSDEEKAQIIESEKEKANAISLGMDPGTVIKYGQLNKALGNVQKAVAAVLIEEIMQSATMSEIMSTFDKLPGSNLIAKYMATWKCPNTHWVNPPISNFLSTLTFDPCGPEGIRLHLPPLPRLKSLLGWNIWKHLFSIFWNGIRSMFFSAIISLMLKLAQLVDKALCTLAGVPAKIAMSAAEGGLSSLADADTWSKMLDEMVCGEDAADAEARNKRTADLMSKIGISPRQSTESAPDTTSDTAADAAAVVGPEGDFSLTRKGGSFNPLSNTHKTQPLSGGRSNQVAPNQGPQSMEKLVELGKLFSTMATKNELTKAITSLPEEQDISFMKNISTMVNLKMPEFSHVLGTPDLVSLFFSTVGNFLSPDQRQQLKDQQGSPSFDFPVNDSVCLTDDQKAEWDAMRAMAMINAGAKPKDALDTINRINDRDKSDFATALDLLTRSPEGVLQDTIDNIFSPDGDPDCKLKPVFNIEPDEIKAEIKAINDGLFKNLARAYTEDLLDWNVFERWDANGLLSVILSNKKGHLLNKHNLLNGSVFWRFMFTGGLKRFEAPKTVGIKMREELKSQNLGYKSPFMPAVEGIFGEGLADLAEGVIDIAGEIVEESTDVVNTAYEEILDANAEYYMEDREESVLLEFDNGENFESTISVFEEESVKSPITAFDYKVRIRSPIFSSVFKVEKQFSIEEQEYLFSFAGATAGIEPTNLEMMAEAVIASEVPTDKQEIERAFFNERWKGLPGANFSKGDTVQVSEGINTLMHDDYLKKLLDGRGGEIPEGFLYGSEAEPLTVDDLTYVDPEPGSDKYTYDEEDKVLGRSKTENPRVHFLDPDKHGGTYTNPHRYIEAEAECGDQRGWMMLGRFIAPNIICGTKENDFLYLNQLMKRIDGLSIESHEKLNEAPDCVFEAPFDKIASSKTLANLEGTVIATIRIYITEFIIKAMPILSNINLSDELNYDELISEYILKQIEMGCIDQVSWWTSSVWEGRNYWLLFLEQSVQTVMRMIENKEIGEFDDNGELIGPTELIKAKERILSVQKEYSNPQEAIDGLPDDWTDYAVATGAGAALMTGILIASGPVGWAIVAGAAAGGAAFGTLVKFAKDGIDMAKSKFAFKIAGINSAVPKCKTMLKYLIRHQLSFYRDEINLKLRPRPYIYDVTKYFLGGSGLSLGIKPAAGTSDVENPVGGGEGNYSYGNVNDCVNDILSENPIDKFDLSNEEVDRLKKSGGFFLEKYIRIVSPKLENNDPKIKDDVKKMVLNRGPSLTGVVNIKRFKDFLRDVRTTVDANVERRSSTSETASAPETMPTQNAERESVGGTTMLSELFGDQAYSSLKEKSEELQRVFDKKDAEREELSITGIKFGVRVCYVPPEGVNPMSDPNGRDANSEDSDVPKDELSLPFAQLEKSFLYKRPNNHDYDSSRFIFPICSFEQELPDASLEDYLNTNDLINQDLKCYIDNMAETKEYKLFFHKMYDVRKIPSLMAVYSALNFIPSLGQGTDERDFLEDDPISNEEISEGFNDSKYTARRLFVSLYRRNDFDPPDEENDYDFLRDEFKRAWANSIGRINFSDDVPFWLRKRIDNAPYDCDKAMCENSFSKLYDTKDKEKK